MVICPYCEKDFDYTDIDWMDVKMDAHKIKQTSFVFSCPECKKILAINTI